MKYFLLLLCGLASISNASDLYFLCGPDEDGCSPSYYYACLCMPYDDISAQGPYCLRFDTVACVPLSQAHGCPAGDVVKDQGSCLALAFQSEADPPCLMTHKTFCVSHHIPICAQDGGEGTCKALTNKRLF